jgi:hypothetical protein
MSNYFNHTTRDYVFANGTRTATVTASSAAVALGTLGPTREIMLHATARCFIIFGGSGVAAAQAAAGHLVLEAGERFLMRASEGVTHFRVIRDTGDGHLDVTPVL